jgi:hypothetical protein
MTRLEGFVQSLSENEATISRIDRSTVRIDRALLPHQATVGDFIIETEPGQYHIDRVISEKRRHEMRRMTDGCMD